MKVSVHLLLGFAALARRLSLLALLLATVPGLATAVPLQPETVEVGHSRELRGVWVASVSNMHFPSRPGLSAEQQKAELRALVARVAECRLNAIFFQVRPEGDALYASALEPWSRFLTGKQGGDPGYDPLAYLIPLAHQAGIEVHAWLNPYRASASPMDKTAMVAPHLGALHPDKVLAYGSFGWMEPTAPEVQKRLVEVCRDLTRRYDLDGIHFDDYFYPYPEGGLDFPDDSSWTAYQGPMNRADWRRHNVNQAVAQVARAVHLEKPHVRFGISPFGLPAPDRPEGIAGFDQHAKLYADPQLWSDHGYVDYLAPQLYWPTTRKEQALKPLLDWWTDHARRGRYTFAGLNLNALGSKPEWTLDEYRLQMQLVRERADLGARGVIWWSVKPLLEDRQGVVGFFTDLYPEPALSPPLVRFRAGSVKPPRCTLDGGQVAVESRDDSDLRCWAVYRDQGQRWSLESLVAAPSATVSLPPGRYAITAVTRYGTESHGQVVTVR
jgi:uncharacterized lipoprotein YddW (UPF0748 family)